MAGLLDSLIGAVNPIHNAINTYEYLDENFGPTSHERESMKYSQEHNLPYEPGLIDISLDTAMLGAPIAKTIGGLTKAIGESTLGSNTVKNIGWADGTQLNKNPMFENLGNQNVPDNVVDQFFKFNDELKAGENASRVAWDNMQMKVNNLIKEGKFNHMKDPRLGVHATNYPDNLEFIADNTKSSYRNFRGTYTASDADAARYWASQGEYSIPFVYDANTIANMGEKIPSTLLKEVGSKFRGNIKNPTLHDIRNNSVYRQQDINGIPLSLQDMNSNVLSKMGKTGVDVYNGEMILLDNANVKSIIGNTEFNPNTANIFKGLIPGLLGIEAYEGEQYEK